MKANWIYEGCSWTRRLLLLLNRGILAGRVCVCVMRMKIINRESIEKGKNNEEITKSWGTSKCRGWWKKTDVQKGEKKE